MNNKIIEELKSEMLNEFSKRLDTFVRAYNKVSRKDLKKEIQALDNQVLISDEKLAMFQLILATTVYKQRFKREIALKGVKIDASGNVGRNDDNNFHRNI
ncbi:hypothetical protein [Vagococcus carniphilus]|uniref:hypothetical protein n=1 Tax=Vagococcus carniphilus TaxID=218144 RepID=UPI002890A79B|nr:hypothetical protein [Vagococcus carniphilus]MDT2839301.1 hypothetical protein [Vagococcus carniphilus]